MSNFDRIPERRIALRARILAVASCVAAVSVLGSVLLAEAQTEPAAKPQTAPIAAPVATPVSASPVATANDFAPTPEVFAKVKTAEGRRAFVQNFCTGCHSARAKAGNGGVEVSAVRDR